MVGVECGLRVLILLLGAAGLAACGGQQPYTQEQYLDRVECTVTGAGGTSMPRQACLDQGGVVF